MRIKSPEEALELFCSAAIKHSQATENGQYQIGNRAYEQIMEALRWLEANQATSQVSTLLKSSSIGTRLWAASYLLLHGSSEAEATLAMLAAGTGIHSFAAAMTLGEWRAGRLKSFP